MFDLEQMCSKNDYFFPFVSLYQRQSLQSYRYVYDVKFTLLQNNKERTNERKCPDKLTLS